VDGDLYRFGIDVAAEGVGHGDRAVAGLGGVAVQVQLRAAAAPAPRSHVGIAVRAGRHAGGGAALVVGNDGDEDLVVGLRLARQRRREGGTGAEIGGAAPVDVGDVAAGGELVGLVEVLEREVGLADEVVAAVVAVAGRGVVDLGE